MKHIGLVILVYSALILQISLRPQIMIGSVGPDFLTLTTAIAAFLLPGRTAIVWSAVIGLLADTLAGGPLGVEMFCAVGVTFAFHTIVVPGNNRSWLSSFLFGFPFIFTLLLTSSAARGLMVGQHIDWAPLTALSAWTSVYSTLLFFVLLWLFAKGRQVLATFKDPSNEWSAP